MSYYLAPSLVQLRGEVNDAWPHRSRASDGWIGDTAHSARKSDHNPNARGAVDAIDITAAGIDAERLIALLIRDPRVNYVIHRGRIWSRVRAFKATAYHGSNPHDHHVHVSIRQARTAEQDRRPWGIAKLTTTPAAPAAPTVQEDDMTEADRKLLTELNRKLDALIEHEMGQGRGRQADDRVLGFLVQRRDAKGQPARALDTLDGDTLRGDIRAVKG